MNENKKDLIIDIVLLWTVGFFGYALGKGWIIN